MHSCDLPYPKVHLLPTTEWPVTCWGILRRCMLLKPQIHPRMLAGQMPEAVEVANDTRSTLGKPRTVESRNPRLEFHQHVSSMTENRDHNRRTQGGVAIHRDGQGRNDSPDSECDRREHHIESRHCVGRNMASLTSIGRCHTSSSTNVNIILEHHLWGHSWYKPLLKEIRKVTMDVHCSLGPFTIASG
jgi:hypothetical protein